MDTKRGSSSIITFPAAYSQLSDGHTIPNTNNEQITRLCDERRDAVGDYRPYPPETDALSSIYGHQTPVMRPPFIVRPISPSTLIALTEPCLMAWCYNEDLDFNCTNSPVLALPISWPSVGRRDKSGTLRGVNSWGY